MSGIQFNDGGLTQTEQHISICRAMVLGLRQDSDNDQRSAVLKHLADALMADHASSYNADSVEEAIAVYDQVLQLRPVGHGNAMKLFDLLREAVLLRPPSHPLRDRSLHNLARALYVVKYIQQSGNLAVLTECIQLGREALQLRPAGHPEHAHTLGNLALALMSFFERCGDPAVLLECISMKREVLQLLKPGHPRRDFPLNNLAIALRQFAWSYGSVEALAETEGLFREVLALRPPGHPLRFQVLDNLAGSLRMRFDLQNLPTALVEAIMLMRQAWEIQPASHPDHWKLMSNLAQCLIVDFRHRHDSSSITEAIMLLRRLLVLKPPGSYASVFVLNSLAEALLARFDEYGDFVDLLEAITLQREALTMSPPGSIQRPKALQCLGRLLCKPRCRSWHEALALFQEALVSCPAGHSSRPSLSSDLSICFLDPESPLFDITKGIAHLSESYSNELSHVNQRLGQAVLDLRRLETAFTVFARDVDELTTNLYSSQILELYAQAIRLLPHAANFGLDHKTRLQVIASSDEIARNAAARALLLGHTSQAVELLEEGRGVFWSQTLHLRATGFENVPDSDRENLVRLLRMLEHGTRTSDNSGQTVAQREEALERRRRLNEEAQTLISRIRTYPGCTRFLMPSAFASLYSGLPDGFVVIINASKLSHHALLLHKVTGLATSLKLQSPSTCLNWTNLRARLPRDVDAQSEQEYKSTSRAMRLDNTRADSLEQVLSQLWTGMVQSILRMLGLEEAMERARPRLWWCVTGELGFLPIHAAGQYGNSRSDCAANYVVSSYIPTLSSLTKARSGWVPITRSAVAGLLICETYSDQNSGRQLPGADKEVHIIRKCFESACAHVLNTHAPHTSLADLRVLLQSKPANILHLACHGVQDADPLSSALLMRDGKLTIEDMLQLDLPYPVLAYLSACQTAKGDKNAPDQAVHLAASMLFCGFRSVVGTMWLMHDEDGSKLARRFYEALFAKDTLDLDDIAYALDEAVQALRNQGLPAQRWALFMHMGG